MTDRDEKNPANALCRDCGLCCTGHLFAWAKLKSSEMKSAEALGLTVLGSDPKQRGFNQPCPLWDGECTVYTSPHYPHYCRQYKCKLLKKVLDETTSLSDALAVVAETQKIIQEVERLLPASSNRNFRERLVAHIEQEIAGSTFQQKAHQLLTLYKDKFGVQDLVDHLDETDVS